MSNEDTERMPTGKAFYIFVMVILGAAAFAGLGWLVEYREGLPLHEAPSAAMQEAAQQAPMSVLQIGAQTSLQEAVQAFRQDRRSKAAHALDAAMRAVKVGMHASRTPTQKHWTEAHSRIKKARRALQTGDPTAARRALQKAIATLEQITASDGPPENRKAPSGAGKEAYEGALLINAQGIRIGEVRRVSPAEAGRSEAVLVLGGARDVLGLFDWGGTRVTMPADRLLYGNPQTIGMVHVVLPSFESSPVRLERAGLAPSKQRSR